MTKIEVKEKEIYYFRIRGYLFRMQPDTVIDQETLRFILNVMEIDYYIECPRDNCHKTFDECCLCPLNDLDSTDLISKINGYSYRYEYIICKWEGKKK